MADRRYLEYFASVTASRASDASSFSFSVVQSTVPTRFK